MALAYLGAKTIWHLDFLPALSTPTVVGVVAIAAAGIGIGQAIEHFRARRFAHRHPLVERLLDTAEVFCPACRDNRMPIAQITCDSCESARKVEPVNGLYHHPNGTAISADPAIVASWYAARSARIEGIDAAANVLQPNQP